MWKGNTRYKVLTPTGFQSFVGVQKLRKEGYRFECDNGLYCEVSKGHRFVTSCGEILSDDIGVDDTIVHRQYGEVKIKKKINLEESDVYDLLGVAGESIYYADGFIHHNCEFIGSSNTVIDSKCIEKLFKKREEPNFLDMKGRFRIWEKPKPGCSYVLGVDTAKGTGENHSVIQILRVDSITPVTMKQVAVWEDNYTDVYTFAAIVHKTSYYYNDAYIMVENNGEGAPVVQRLWWEYENQNLINTGGREKDLGVRATNRSKTMAVLLMKKLLEDENIQLVDPRTIEQLSDFQDLGNGKFGGVNIADDLVSGLYWAIYILEQEVFDEIRKEKANSVLYSNELGDLCLTSAYGFPKMFNSLPMTEALRGNIRVIRGYWLGLGNVGRFDAIKDKFKINRSVEYLDKAISEQLVLDLVKMAASYHFDTDITDRAKIVNAEKAGKSFEVRHYRSKFENSFANSSYTYDLVLALANLFEDPKAELPKIPETVNVGYYYTSYEEAKKDLTRPAKWENCEVIRLGELEACRDLIIQGKYSLFGEKQKPQKDEEIEELKQQLAELTKAFKTHKTKETK